jgi:hypothetical protein
LSGCSAVPDVSALPLDVLLADHLVDSLELPVTLDVGLL